jgi:hypothetical protein
VADSDREGANRVALGLLAAGKVEGRVLNHLIEQGRQAGFRDLTFQLFDDFRVRAEQIVMSRSLDVTVYCLICPSHRSISSDISVP